ncbi:MAG: hypothetical protein EpisKO_40840 [Epibacterium sp.]
MKTSIIITSINQPEHAVNKIAALALDKGWDFFLIGDRKGPARFELDGCQLITLEDQRALDFKLARTCPEGHYARKNIGYLLAIATGTERLYETDDDNIPYDTFWMPDSPDVAGGQICNSDTPVNAYQLFTSGRIWPRGYPLSDINASFEAKYLTVTGDSTCPVWQGLANENPDVDAIFRLTYPMPFSFEARAPVALGKKAWCPFNSQNTTWFKSAFPLLYLPAYCSFRMTDIWRSFVAQRIMWANNWNLMFHEATVYQERNEHDLMRDFTDEIPGYRFNERILELLDSASMKAGAEHIPENLRIAYGLLVEEGLVGAEELPLLENWIEDLHQLG